MSEKRDYADDLKAFLCEPPSPFETSAELRVHANIHHNGAVIATDDGLYVTLTFRGPLPQIEKTIERCRGALDRALEHARVFTAEHNR